MNNLHALHEAFAELEARADAAPVRDVRPAPRSAQRRPHRLLAPVAAAAAVLVAAGGIALVQHGRTAGTRAAGGHAAGGQVELSNPPAASAHESGPNAPAAFVPPATGEQLAERTSEILAGIATIHVTDYGRPVTMTLPGSTAPAAGSGPDRSPVGAPLSPVISKAATAYAAAAGSAIVGTLTSARGTGGFDLNVFVTTPGAARCDTESSCTVRTLADGSSLAVSSWQDTSTPGGVTYQVELVRSDGADILVHLSTQRDPKGLSTVTSTELPLTVDQLIAFVRSDRW